MRKILFFISLLSFLSADVLLLSTYTKDSIKDEDLKDFVMSEKYDGVRAIWDGKNLYTRNKHKIQAPKFFTQHFPNFRLDGELFMDRKSFDRLSSIVRSFEVNETQWLDIKYMVFDVPDVDDTLKLRLQKLKNYLDEHKEANKFIKIIEQKDVKSKENLQKFSDEIHSLGGEGVVLRNNLARYEKIRSKNAFKLKKYEEADCIVKGYIKGKGKYENMLGAILCEAVIEGESKLIKIGSGFSDELRKNPPFINSKIRYKFNGYTKNKLPRFAVFKGIRAD